MTVCKFFLEGNCKFGDRCRNEHPSKSSFGGNRFATLQNGNNGGSRARSNAFGSNATDSGTSKLHPYHETLNVQTDVIKRDLTTGGDGERPVWPLSVYAPCHNPPRQLIEGDVEQSPEEMRVKCYIAKAAGNLQAYEEQEKTLVNQMDQQISTILRDLEGAKRYIEDGANVHPNRWDIELKPKDSFPEFSKLAAPGIGFGNAGPSSGFGQPSAFGGAGNAAATGSSAFGASSAKPSAFGGSGFGQTSASNAPKSAFGNPSPMGTSKSAFGAPSAMGTTSGFGQASALGGGGSAFGKPSGLGLGGGGFGQSSTLGQQSTAFGGSTQKPNPFGQPSQPAASGTSPFAAAAQQTPAFGQSGFGSTSKPSGFSTGSQPGFGQPSKPGGFGQPSFGQPAQPSAFIQSTLPLPSAFGDKPAPSGTAFGQATSFGAAASKASPFLAASQNQLPSQTNSGFGKSGFSTTSAPSNQPNQPSQSTGFSTQAPAFGAPSQPKGLGGFGAPSAFGKATSGFGQSGFGQQQGATSTSPFAPKPTSTAQQPATGPATNPFAPPTASSAIPSASPFSQPSTTSGQNIPEWKRHRLVSKPVAEGDPPDNNTYYQIRDARSTQPTATKYVRVWFPDGTPQQTVPTSEAADLSVYLGPLGDVLKEIYDYARVEGKFKDGIMPEIPPKQEWRGFEI